MATTLLYVELIVIGVETSIWLILSIFYSTNLETTKYILHCSNSVSCLAFAICLFYIIGVIFDRFSDAIFQCYENNARKKSGIIAKSTVLIWKKSGQTEFYQYTRSRIRILRSSILNIPLIALSLLLFINKYYASSFPYLNILIILIASLSFIFTIITYCSIVRRYYDKAHIIELDQSNSASTSST